jgi:4-amino-4-deoxy-L-arabinose transferase-like glycosyltransferase
MTRTRAWVGVAAIAVVGVCLRLAYLQWVSAQPGFTWTDPDYYLAKVLDQAGVEWSRRLVHAVEYRHRGRVFHLPPLYSLYLFGFGLTPLALAGAAAVGHTLLAGVRVIATYAIGTNLHSRRAGLVAAALVALAPNSLHVAPIFLQEHLYIPLLLSALAMLTWLVGSARPPRWWALCGVAFGLAILTRSMPLYYVPLAAAGIVWFQANRRAAARQVAWLALGTGVVTLTYSVWLSVQVGRWIFVEDHASISMIAYTKVIRTAPPSPLEETLALVEAFADRPGEFLGTFGGFLRSNFRPAAQRWVELYVPFLTGAPRVAAQAYARVMTDGVFVLAVLLAPFGLVLARHRLASGILALWPPLVALLTALSAYGGPRYRGPLEAVLTPYLAVVLAGQWARAPRRELILAGVFSALSVLLVW